MYKLLSRRGQLIAIVLGVALTAIFLITVFSNAGNFGDMDAKALIKSEYSSVFNFGLYAAIFLTVLCAVAMLLFGIFHILTNFKNSIKGLIGIGVLFLIFIIGYSMANPDAVGSLKDTLLEFAISDNQSKLISGGIITTIVLLLVSFASLILFELYNLIK